MINGFFVGNTPLIQVTVAWGQSVQDPFFVLDTGFTGDLQVSPEVAEELGLSVAAITPVRIANGQIISVPVAVAVAVMEGGINNVEVLISRGSNLVGIGLLSKFGYRATVDCKYKTLQMEKAP